MLNETGPAYQLQTITDALDGPWCVAFLPEGGYLVTELAGRLRYVAPDGSVGEPIDGVPDVFFAGQGGLFDVVLDPDFRANQRVYLSYAHGTRGRNATRVARGTLRGNRLENVEVLITVSPWKDTPVHYGGRLLLLPDRTLMLTTGDGFDYREDAQRPATGFGKVLHFDLDGEPITAQPLADGRDVLPGVHTYGHRNPQGLALDSASGAVYLHEHGPRGGDEVNRLLPGGNYGWPLATFGLDYSGARISPFQRYPGTLDGLHVWNPSVGPSGLAVYRGDAFPQWQGDLFVGTLVNADVRRIRVSEDGVREEILFAEVAARVRDVREGPDGALYLLVEANADHGGRLIRVSPLP